MLPYLLLFLSACMSALASVLIKLAGQYELPDFQIQAIVTRPVLLIAAALATYGLGFLFYALALKKLELSLAYPIMVAITILLIYGYGVCIGEQVTMQSMLGAALMVLSIALIYSR